MAKNTYKFQKSQAQRDSEAVTKQIKAETRRFEKSGTREQAISRLHSAGIVDSEGKLKPKYK